MRALSMRTMVKRPEPGAQAKPRPVDVLHEGLSSMPKPLSTNHHIHGGRLPKAFLDSHSMWRRCYYAKNRTAKGYSARNAEAAICGMRWNYYVSFGKHIHLAAAEERHTSAITSRAMGNASHNTATENEAHQYWHASAAHTAGSATTYVMQSAPAHGQMAQAAASGAWTAVENAGAGHAAHPSSSDAGTSSQTVFSISVSPSSFHHETAGSHHWQGAPEAAWQPHNHEISQAAPVHAGHPPTFHLSFFHPSSFNALSPQGAQPDASTHVLQMDVSLTISYNPLSQLSYIPTYQVGAYAIAQAFAAAPAIGAAAPAAQANEPAQTAIAAPRAETGYISNLPKKQFMLKVAHADAVPE